MRKRLGSLVLTAVLAGTVMTGCGSSGGSTGSPSESVVPEESSSENTEESGSETPLDSLAGDVTSADTGQSPEASVPDEDAKSGPDMDDEGNSAYRIVTIAKLTNSAWFDRMETGVDQFGEDSGVQTSFTGPSEADPEEQVKVIEQAIADGADAICVVPDSTEAVEEVLKKARDQGIVVVTHEAADITNADFDIEAFSNKAYGEHFMDQLGGLMEGHGRYTTYVGSLEAASHNEWVDASTARQEAMYPDMELISNKNTTSEDIDVAYAKTKELLGAFPDLVGFEGSSMYDEPGIAQAITEAGLEDETYVIGTSLVSVAGDYLANGSIDEISFWDPAEAGYAMNEIALMLLQGREPEDGLSLNAVGYQDMTLEGRVFYGRAWVDVTTDNMGDYDF